MTKGELKFGHGFGQHISRTSAKSSNGRLAIECGALWIVQKNDQQVNNWLNQMYPLAYLQKGEAFNPLIQRLRLDGLGYLKGS